MARERRDDPRRRDPRGNGGGRVLSFISGLLIGLTVAVVVYFSMLSKPPAGAPETAARPTVQPKTPPPKAPAEEEPPVEEAVAPTTPAGNPKPAFDFYKILPDTEVKVPDEELSGPTSAAPASPTTQPAPANNPAYVLQVGSYQKYEEADQKKAQLALQGVTSRIERTVANGQEVWFRVHVGPLKTAQEAQAMKGRLQEGGSDVVVLKVDAGR